MQRFVEMINRDDEKEVIFEAVKNDIVNMAFHNKGNFVLIPIINIFKGEMLDQVVEQLLEYVIKLVTDQCGVCIVNAIIKNTTNKNHIQEIVNELATNITDIIQNQYGNYAITVALETWKEESIYAPIMSKLTEYF